MLQWSCDMTIHLYVVQVLVNIKPGSSNHK